jgi:hypothetical protein
MPLSNVEKAKYEIVIDREKSKILKNKEYKTQKSLTILSGCIGIPLAVIDFLTGAVFIAAALFFASRWRTMEQNCLDSQEKILRYQHFLDLESE